MTRARARKRCEAISELAWAALGAVALELGCAASSGVSDPGEPDAGPARVCRTQGSEPIALAPEEEREPSAPRGGPAKPAADAPCPPEMALVRRFCIDRWEAHLSYQSAGRFTVLHPHTERPKESRAYVARSEAGVFPQGYISRVEAEKACVQAGKRLCTFREWRRACQGSKGARYPYGFRAENGRCNVSKPHLLPKLFGNDSRLWKYEQFNSPELLAEPGYLARTGEYERCVGESGVYDLRGNLHEWVAGTVTDELMATLEKDDVERDKQPWTVGNGIFVGGFFSTTNEHGPGCLFTTVAHEPRYHDYSTGFRCCKDAPTDEPKKPTKPNPPSPRPKAKSGSQT